MEVNALSSTAATPLTMDTVQSRRGGEQKEPLTRGVTMGAAMKTALAALLLASTIAVAAEPTQIVPPQVIFAKTIAVRVYYPSGAIADVNEVKLEAEQFLRKWHRYEIIDSAEKADLTVEVAVEPLRVEPRFWQRVAWGIAASQAGSHCATQFYGDQAYTNCYTTPAPAPLMPSVVLNGSILLFDGNDLRKWKTAGPDVPMPDPIMAALAEGHGSRPLVGAGKKLRKMIDEAAKVQKEHK